MADAEVVLDGARSLMVTAVVERTLSPGVVDEMAARASDDELIELCAQMKTLQGVTWTTHCILIGHMLHRICEREKGNPKTRVQNGVRVLARQLEMPKSEICRAGQVYTEILLPRIEEQGAAATFPVRGRTYYDIAVQAAHISKKPALEIFEAAEEKVIAGGYSLRAFRQELIDNGTIPASSNVLGQTLDELGAGFKAMLVAIVATKDDVISRLVANDRSDLTEKLAPALLLLRTIANELGIEAVAAEEYTGPTVPTVDRDDEEVDFEP